ncbi:TetR/AcrR family transcriptional regulator [Martelella alba]|uniref:TetR/AcrR family transcriptional regulator n=2 Tax=Martelella alba TaxID=2590451 RepID=A0ABY2SJ31_9HYPH|nr:TetR/AcrR family transcriptional regulator [Martelella alba]
MDAIAVAAGVGKGTLFRAFGSRDGLLDTLWAAKLKALREAVDAGPPPLGPATPSDERLAAFLDALLIFKLENKHLIRAREVTATGLLQSIHYRWMYGLVRELIQDAAQGTMEDSARYRAHALLAALHIDLIEALLADGLTLQTIRHAQKAHVKAIIDGA